MRSGFQEEGYYNKCWDKYIDNETLTLSPKITTATYLGNCTQGTVGHLLSIFGYTVGAGLLTQGLKHVHDLPLVWGHIGVRNIWDHGPGLAHSGSTSNGHFPGPWYLTAAHVHGNCHNPL